MFENELSQLRHTLRGRLQALNLCATVLGQGTTPTEDAQFLADIIDATNEIPVLLDRLDQLLPAEEPISTVEPPFFPDSFSTPPT